MPSARLSCLYMFGVRVNFFCFFLIKFLVCTMQCIALDRKCFGGSPRNGHGERYMTKFVTLFEM